MNDPYKQKHLQEYTGILISDDARGESFKMELKVEDNPVMERLIDKNQSTIELEFRYNGGPSTMFFHNPYICPNYKQGVDCHECEKMYKVYEQFRTNLSHLQSGDTFRIRAALVNDGQSVLPAEIYNFQRYQPLLVACTTDTLRLADTSEGLKKKQELQDQRLQSEREAEKKRKRDEKQAKNKEEWTKIKQQIFGDSPYGRQITASIIGGLIAGIVLTIFFDPILHLFRQIFLL